MDFAIKLPKDLLMNIPLPTTSRKTNETRSKGSHFKPETMDFSVYLPLQAANQIDFLKMVDQVPELKQRNFLAKSVYRYEKYWLPLAAAYPDECLSAPLDIEWVWHCHMLSPRAYERDCEEIVQQVVNHTLRSKTDYGKALTKSRELWVERFHNREPFCIDYSDETAHAYESKITYNIIEAASRQRVFYYQVSLPHYRDIKFLDASLERYKKFLHLKQELPDEFIVPCYDIDLIWHSHQLNPRAYKADMMQHIGHLFNHDDTVTDRSEGSKLYNADKSTREHWRNIYNESFATFGAMYRGPPPEGVLHRISAEETYGYSTKQSAIQLHDISVLLHRSLHNIRLNVFGCNHHNNDKWQLMNIKKKSGLKLTGHKNFRWNNEDLRAAGSFVYDTKAHSCLHFVLLKIIGFSIFKKDSVACSGSFDLSSIIENPENRSGGEIDIHIPLAGSSTEGTIRLKGRFDTPTAGSAVFQLEPGIYETAIIPENIQDLWGPIALERLPRGKDNQCKVASHRLTKLLLKFVIKKFG